MLFRCHLFTLVYHRDVQFFVEPFRCYTVPPAGPCWEEGADIEPVTAFPLSSLL